MRRLCASFDFMPEVLISVENLGKKYRISHEGQRQRYVALRDVLAQKWTAPFRALIGKNGIANGSTAKLPFRKNPTNSDANSSGHPTTGLSLPSKEDFWALRDVSFDVKRGEVVGIIGRNGAGKSTLLKILSRITEPTEGRVRIRGRVASLLEVGTGFHPELTGRENVFLNGAIMGMSKAEIRHKFDEIVAFAEVEKFLDTPVKRYSSGMYVRLAFAVAAHLEPEILVVDEVLAVGDSQFQKKCLGKMQDVAAHEGRTVLFVSHQMEAISALTQRCLYLKGGRSVLVDKTSECIKKYLYEDASSTVYSDHGTSSSDRITQITVITDNGGSIVHWGESLTIECEVWTQRPIERLDFALQIYSSQGKAVLHFYPTDSSLSGAKSTRPNCFLIRCHIPKLRLYQGDFFITTWLADGDSRALLQCLDKVVSFSVSTDELAAYKYGRNPEDCVYVEDHSFDLDRP
jgi:lipopolysaccharide transport system ATP-binding protein